MNILVINGSPKGKYSTTLHTALFLEKKFPAHSFSYINAGQQINSLEKNFKPAEEELKKAELIIFCYPVYTFIVPSQLHRFIELMKKCDIDYSGKFATQITTSKHFYDITAHRFIEENSFDMGFKVIKGLSADMDDILSEKGQKEAKDFFSYCMWCSENDIYERNTLVYREPSHKPVTVPVERNNNKSGDIVVVADLAEDDRQLKSMIDRFTAVIDKNVRMVNIHDFPFRGGCISCFNCAPRGECIYKDGFQELLRNEIQKSDAIVIAFSIKDHSMGSIFKTYDDRQFCNGHRTVTMGKPFGYIVSGNYSIENNLKMVIDGRAEVGGYFLAGVATDEFDPDSEIDKLAKRLSYAVENRYVQPSNFLGVGGMKIFRDLIWLMQGLMRADHKFYKKHGQYDFPQKKRGTMLFMYLPGAMMSSKKLKSKIGNQMNEGMIAPYKKMLEKADRK